MSRTVCTAVLIPFVIPLGQEKVVITFDKITSILLRKYLIQLKN